MVESMDNGKPIRETMAIDIPYSSDHFRYFAGCILAEEGSANMLDGNTLSPDPAGAHRRGGPDRALELPLPDGRLEAGPRAGRRLTAPCSSLSTTPR